VKLNLTFNFTDTRAAGAAGVERSEKRRAHRHRDPSECRCLCGSLVARRVPEGVELRCRRCKRIVVLPLDLAQPIASGTEANP
jgi:hypothetical protein